MSSFKGYEKSRKDTVLIFKKKLRPLLFAVILICGILHTLFITSENFAELYTLKIAPFFRIPLSFISSLVPFSLGESFILILSVIGVFFIVSALITLLFKKKTHWRIYLRILVYSVVFITVTFVLTFDSSYRRHSIDENIGLQMVEMNAESVASALGRVIEEAYLLEETISYHPTESTNYNMSFSDLAKKVNEAADTAAKKYSYLQRHGFPAKPVAFSLPLAYTGISGVYTFFTGESNVNTVFASYSIPFTIAHEYSHQRGIGPENEAEFSAFLICLESDDPYIRYSAYSQAAITLSNLLFEYDKDLFYESLSRFPEFLFYDIVNSSKSYEEYSKTSLDEVASAINDTYLKANSDKGVVSYSLSAELYCAYLQEVYE